jgi:hypothetical protein
MLTQHKVTAQHRVFGSRAWGYFIISSHHYGPCLLIPVCDGFIVTQEEYRTALMREVKTLNIDAISQQAIEIWPENYAKNEATSLLCKETIDAFGNIIKSIVSETVAMMLFGKIAKARF